MNLKALILNKTIFFTFLLLTAFTYREPNYCKLADRITKMYVKEVAKPQGLLLYGYGGAMMDDIQSITLRFFSQATLNVDEARKLYVEMMEEYLSRINSHEKIRAYLHNFPFEVDNIKLTISFIDFQGRTLKDGHTAMIFIGRNHTLHIDAYDPNTNDFYTLKQEPYEEARKIVKGY